MKVSDIITQVRTELVEPVAGFWTDDELLGWINRFERHFNNLTRIMENKAMMTLVPGRSSYRLPGDWLSAKAVFVNNNNADSTLVDDWKRLEPTRLEKMAQENPDFMTTDSTTFDLPRNYWIFNYELNFFPTPKFGLNIVLFYNAKPILLLTTTEDMNIDDSFEEYAIAYVLWKAWSKEKERGDAAEQRAIYFDGVREARKWVKKRSGDQRYRLDIISALPISGGTSTFGFNPFSGVS